MRSDRILLMAFTISGLAASVVSAQGPPGAGGGGGFNFGAFQKWRDQHKMTFQLSTTVTRGIENCERSSNAKLKPDQAKKILGVLAPLKKKDKLTQDEAKEDIKKLQTILDQKQLAEVDK